MICGKENALSFLNPNSKVGRERSGSVVECLTQDRDFETEGPRVRASPASLRCGP